MRVYYAHPLDIYNTPQESKDIQELKNLGLYVVNPNTVQHSEGYNFEGMKYFENVVKSCTSLAFRALPDGRIPAGIAKEIAWALEVGLHIIELPYWNTERIMTVDETRKYLIDVGYRKAN